VRESGQTAASTARHKAWSWARVASRPPSRPPEWVSSSTEERSVRGASYYYSDSPNFRRLNAVAVVFEYSADADGNTKSKAWEWK